MIYTTFRVSVHLPDFALNVLEMISIPFSLNFVQFASPECSTGSLGYPLRWGGGVSAPVFQLGLYFMFYLWARDQPSVKKMATDMIIAAVLMANATVRKIRGNVFNTIFFDRSDCCSLPTRCSTCQLSALP